MCVFCQTMWVEYNCMYSSCCIEKTIRNAYTGYVGCCAVRFIARCQTQMLRAGRYRIPYQANCNPASSKIVSTAAVSMTRLQGYRCLPGFAVGPQSLDSSLPVLDLADLVSLLLAQGLL